MFLLHGVSAVAAGIFFYFMLPETKGKTLEEIDKELRLNRYDLWLSDKARIMSHGTCSGTSVYPWRCLAGFTTVRGVVAFSAGTTPPNSTRESTVKFHLRVINLELAH